MNGEPERQVLRIDDLDGNGVVCPAGSKRNRGMKVLTGPAFGYAASVNTGLAYRQATDIDFWVDDIHSMQYNQWVTGTPAANSFEHMKRRDNLYQYGIVIGYNTHPVIPGAGSAIFMHVWRRYDSPTSGCVALDQRYLRKILRWLNQQYQPVIILE